MSNISNKGLIYLILLTLALSVFTTILSLDKISNLSDQLGTPTGFATSNTTGSASIELAGAVSIALNVADLDWGSGIVNQTNPNCANVTLTTTGATAATLNPNNCWTNVSGQSSAIMEANDFQIENTGTSTVTLSINSSNSTTFFDFGSADSTNFMWRGAEYATDTSSGDACGSGNILLNTSWNEFDTTFSQVCGGLEWDNDKDQILVELNMSFNRNEVTSNAKTATIQFRAENASI